MKLKETLGFFYSKISSNWGKDWSRHLFHCILLRDMVREGSFHSFNLFQVLLSSFFFFLFFFFLTLQITESMHQSSVQVWMPMPQHSSNHKKPMLPVHMLYLLIATSLLKLGHLPTTWFSQCRIVAASRDKENYGITIILQWMTIFSVWGRLV